MSLSPPFVPRLPPIHRRGLTVTEIPNHDNQEIPGQHLRHIRLTPPQDASPGHHIGAQATLIQARAWANLSENGSTSIVTSELVGNNQIGTPVVKQERTRKREGN